MKHFFAFITFIFWNANLQCKCIFQEQSLIILNLVNYDIKIYSIFHCNSVNDLLFIEDMVESFFFIMLSREGCRYLMQPFIFLTIHDFIK